MMKNLKMKCCHMQTQYNTLKGYVSIIFYGSSMLRNYFITLVYACYFKDHNTVNAGLPNVSSSASLFKLLKEFDVNFYILRSFEKSFKSNLHFKDDGDEMRAPFIPMDDLIFVNNTSDGSVFSS